MDVGASILQKIPVSRYVSISEGKVSWGLDPHFSMVASSSGLGRCALRTETEVRIFLRLQNFNLMTYPIILIGLAVLLAFLLVMAYSTFHEDENLMLKIISVCSCLMVGAMLVSSIFIFREEIRSQTIQRFVDKEIEIVERIDTVRTFKIN